MSDILTCVIIDDEPLAVRLLESFVERTPEVRLMASFTDSVGATDFLRNNVPDLVFLDIQMPDVNGMELARMLPKDTKVVFTTAFKEFAYDSYEVSALDFLLKPIRYNKFVAAVDKAKAWFGRTRRADMVVGPDAGTATNTVFIRIDGQLRQVVLDNVLYVAGMKDYVMFCIEGERRPLVTHLTMKAVEAMLPKARFMRVHRSYIVALDKIRSVDRNDCIYIGDQIVRVTDAYKEDFERYLKSKSI